MSPTLAPVPRRLPFSVLAKPTGSVCNLDCTYCYFLSKEALHGGHVTPMDEATLRAYLANLLESQPDGDVEIAWQGGEPLLRGLDFYRHAVALADGLRRPGQRVRHALQTNATLVDDEWAAFLAEHRFLVGVSIDGPADVHDVYRVNRAGHGTHAQVVRGWHLLREHGVDVNVLCTVHAANQHQGQRVYRYLRDELGARYLQFIPIVERVPAADLPLAEAGWRGPGGARPLYRQDGTAVTSRSVGPRAWGEFLCAVVDEWVRADVGEVFVQHVEAALANVFHEPSMCVHAPVCGAALAVEPNGDVYSCDHFVEPGHRRGNVATASLQAVLASPRQRAFGQAKLRLPRQCQACDVRWACHGGCPKDRFTPTPDGPGLNHLCEGYHLFFSHLQPTVEAIAALLRAGRPATDLLDR